MKLANAHVESSAAVGREARVTSNGDSMRAPSQRLNGGHPLARTTSKCRVVICQKYSRTLRAAQERVRQKLSVRGSGNFECVNGELSTQSCSGRLRYTRWRS